MQKPSKKLETFLNKALRQCVLAGYHPTVFRQMRDRHGTIEAIERLVRSGEIQSGFERLKALGKLEWSIEQAVINFSCEFTPAVQECAEFRLQHAGDKKLRA
jgi:hypothetical protein